MVRLPLHIQITAHDRPGILAEALAFIVHVGWNVIDIKQFVFNGMLNLSILLDKDDILIQNAYDCEVFILANLLLKTRPSEPQSR